MPNLTSWEVPEHLVVHPLADALPSALARHHLALSRVYPHDIVLRLRYQAATPEDRRHGSAPTPDEPTV